MRASLRLLLAAAFLAACGPTPQTPLPAPSGPHALYSRDASSLENPFPDARLFAEEGGLDVARRPGFYKPFVPRKTFSQAGPFFESYAEALRELPGFGNFAPVMVRFSDALDPATLRAADGASRFVYLQRGDAGWQRGPAAQVEPVADALLAAEGKHFVLVRPAVPLVPGRAAALVLLAGVAAADGHALVRSPDFHAEALGAPARVGAFAAACGVRADDVVFAMDLRVEPVTAALDAVRDWALHDAAVRVEIPAKTLNPVPAGDFVAGTDDLVNVFWKWTRGTWPQELDHVGRVVVGRFATRDLRDERRLWTAANIARPDEAPEAMLDFVLTLPAGARPATGYPVIIAGHGVGGRNSPGSGGEGFCLHLAEWLAKAGFGCIGIDAAAHGNRGGITDFFLVADLRVTRDHFRQTAADMLQLARLVRTLDLDGDGKADLDPTPAFFGNSLGGIMGTTYTALDPRVQTIVLNVPGAGLTDVMLSEIMRDRLGVLFAAASGLEFGSDGYQACFPMLRAIAQLVIEPGDPAHYAGRLAGRRVLVQVGKGDRTVPNVASRTLVEAAGLAEIRAPVSSAQGVSGWLFVDPKGHGIDDAAFDPHEVFWRIGAVRDQAARFLITGGTEIPLEP